MPLAMTAISAGNSPAPYLPLEFLREVARAARDIFPRPRHVRRTAPGETIGETQSLSRIYAIDDTLAEFCGTNPDVASLAVRLIQAAKSRTIEPEVTVDVDGTLAFDLRLESGDLMFGELQADGTLSVTVLDDRSENVVVKEHLPAANEDQFLEVL